MSKLNKRLKKIVIEELSRLTEMEQFGSMDALKKYTGDQTVYYEPDSEEDSAEDIRHKEQQLSVAAARKELRDMALEGMSIEELRDFMQVVRSMAAAYSSAGRQDSGALKQKRDLFVQALQDLEQAG